MPLQVMDLTELSSSKQLPVYLRCNPPPPIKLPDKSPWTFAPSTPTLCHPHGVIARQQLLGNDNSSHCRQTRSQRHPVPDYDFDLNIVGRRAHRIGMNELGLTASANATILQQAYSADKAQKCSAILRGDVEPSPPEFLRPRERLVVPIHDDLFVKSLFAPDVPTTYANMLLPPYSSYLHQEEEEHNQKNKQDERITSTKLLRRSTTFNDDSLPMSNKQLVSPVLSGGGPPAADYDDGYNNMTSLSSIHQQQQVAL